MRLLRQRRAGPPHDEGQVLYVEGGRVACPREGDADIEQCYVCGWMAESDLSAPRPTLRCVARERDRGVAGLIAHIL